MITNGRLLATTVLVSAARTDPREERDFRLFAAAGRCYSLLHLVVVQTRSRASRPIPVISAISMPQQPSGFLHFLRQFDFLLLAFLLLTTGFGLLVLDGSTHDVAGMERYVNGQLTWWKVALAIFFLALVIPYRWLKVLGWPAYAITLLFLILVLAHGDLGILGTIKAGGAASWLELRFSGAALRFQPSEFAKIATVIALAHWLAWRRDKLQTVWECLPPLILAAIPMALIARQPDLGTASVFLPLPFLLLFVAGLRWRIVLTASAIGLMLMLACTVFLMTANTVPGLRNYQLKRIRVFLEPISQPLKTPGIEEILYGSPASEKDERVKPSYDDWNIRQAEMALGGGRLFGKGWRKGTQSRYRFLPQHHTDFIFSSLGEQFGLVGCLVLFLLYLLVVWRTLRIGIYSADPFGKLLVVGLLSIVLIHVFMNIGMSVRLLPVTGLPLPFMSYGGSFLVTNYLIFGLIANVGMRRRSRES
ncbi:rod shape-determining protein RodA [bacterium]|nr:rod shape-determining protein RodA [bacterium]